MKCYKCDKELPSQFTVMANSLTVHNQHAWRMIDPAPCAAAVMGSRLVPCCNACDPYPTWFMLHNAPPQREEPSTSCSA